MHDGEVRVPGGDGAAAFWEDLVDAPVTDPERFVDRLFERSSVRVAHAYDLVSRLAERHRRFVLGSWQSNERDRGAAGRACGGSSTGCRGPIPGSARQGRANDGASAARRGGAAPRRAARGADLPSSGGGAAPLSVGGPAALVGPAAREFWERCSMTTRPRESRT